MAAPIAKRFVAVIPGIMGSELLDPARQSRPVWNGDIDRVLDTLSYAPEILQADNPLSVGNVIQSVRVARLPARDTYGKLLERLADADYREEGLLEFPYDWRQDNQQTAARFADACRAKLQQGFEEWSVIAHSMGGLVVRLMLSDPASADLAQSLKRFIQIGSPVRGTLDSYLALRHEFTFGHRLYDFEFWLRQVVDRTLLGRLTDFLRGCPSLFQLLPHAGEPALKLDGTSYDVYNAHWPASLAPALQAAQSVQAVIARPGPKELVTICSKGINTPRNYHVDRFFNKQGTPEYGPGDGTVLVTSAQAGSGPAQLKDPLGRVRHQKLPGSRKTWAIIKDEI